MRCWQDKHRKNNNKSAKVTTTDQRSHSDRSLRFLSSLHCAVFSHLHILISIFYIYYICIQRAFFPYYFSAVTNLATSRSSFLIYLNWQWVGVRPAARATFRIQSASFTPCHRRDSSWQQFSKVPGARVFCELFNYRSEFALLSFRTSLASVSSCIAQLFFYHFSSCL